MIISLSPESFTAAKSNAKAKKQDVKVYVTELLENLLKMNSSYYVLSPPPTAEKQQAITFCINQIVAVEFFYGIKLLSRDEALAEVAKLQAGTNASAPIESAAKQIVDNVVDFARGGGPGTELDYEQDRGHLLYKDGDPDIPDSITDRNGQVVLGLCRKCRRGKIELSEPCTLKFVKPEYIYIQSEFAPADGDTWVFSDLGEWRAKFIDASTEDGKFYYHEVVGRDLTDEELKWGDWYRTTPLDIQPVRHIILKYGESKPSNVVVMPSKPLEEGEDTYYEYRDESVGTKLDGWEEICSDNESVTCWRRLMPLCQWTFNGRKCRSQPSHFLHHDQDQNYYHEFYAGSLKTS